VALANYYSQYELGILIPIFAKIFLLKLYEIGA
jgi:hypothetical protein